MRLLVFVVLSAWCRHLLRLMNVVGVAPKASSLPVVTHMPSGEGFHPSLLIVSTSFGWMMLKDAYESGIFSRVRMDYYNKTYVEWPGGKGSENVPHTPLWRSRFLGEDLYVVDLLETYMPGEGYATEFLRDLTAEIGGVQPEP
jgi:hypothetical protein